MATGTTWSDEQVRAFVDGQLDAATAARFGAQVQQDLALAERVARQRARQRQGAAGGSAVTTTPPPATAAPRGNASLPALPWWLAAAACVVLAALAGWKLPRHTDAPLVAGANGLVAAGPLARALDERISAEGSKADGVLVSLSFRASDGRYCRTFALAAGFDGLACRDGAGWQIEATGRSPVTGTDQAGPLRQPSSDLSASVLAAISRWQAGNALPPEEERRVRDAGWQ